MQKILFTFALGLSLFRLGSLSAQTLAGSFDFNANSLGPIGPGNRWLANATIYGSGGAALTDRSQQLQFTSGSSPNTNAQSLVWASARNDGAYGLDWTATVTVTNLTTSGFVAAGIEAYTLYDAGAGGITNNAYYGLYLTGTGGGSSTSILAEYGVWNGTDFNRSVANHPTTAAIPTSGGVSQDSLLLRLNWTAATQTLGYTVSFDNGINFLTGASYAVGGAQAGIGAPFANGFGLQLVGFSAGGGGTVGGITYPPNSVTVGTGQVTFDNFVVTAVPEPALSAGLFGVLALVGVMLLRRKKATSL